MKILYRYLLGRLLWATLLSTGCLTFVLVLLNAAQRIFDLLVNNDVPFLLIAKLVALLVPAALTFTLPWGMLMGVLVVFGRMGGDHELTAVRAAGIGLGPFVTPAILFGLGLSLVSLFNNSYLAPASMTQFKLAMVDLGKNNPTVFLRAGEPIAHFGSLRLYVEKKAGNRIEGVHCWELDGRGVPRRSIRADYGIVSANIAERSLDITLYGARQEERGPDPTEIDKVQGGMRASQLPLRLSLANLWDTRKVERNITVWTLGQLGEQIISPDGSFQLMPLLTEVHKRLSFSTACFSFCILGIPLALLTHRREASVSFAISLGVVVLYYLMVVLAVAFKEKAGAYPELLVWAPTLLLQPAGFFLLWKVNRHPF